MPFAALFDITIASESRRLAGISRRRQDDRRPLCNRRAAADGAGATTGRVANRGAVVSIAAQKLTLVFRIWPARLGQGASRELCPADARPTLSVGP